MPKLPVKKYYTFTDETKLEVTNELCIKEIFDILKTYTRETILRMASQTSQDLGTSNDPVRILELQSEHFNIPIESDIYLIHRQAILVLLQFTFSFSEDEFGQKNEISKREVFLLFTLINSYLELNEYTVSKKSISKKLFFTSIKTVHLMMNENDIQAAFYFFDKFSSIIESQNLTAFNDIIKEYLDVDITETREIFQKVKDQSYPEIFSFFENFAVVEYDKIDTYWKNRSPKFDIPFEYNFFNQYPLIKKEEDFFVTDLFNLFNSLFSIVYDILVEVDREKFKSVFGKDIAEPVITEFFKEVFKDDEIKFIKVGSSSREFADIGILYKGNIFLFEVKTSIFSRKMLFSTDYDRFIKAFNNKFVLSEGISQQVKRLTDIENNFESFCNLSEIDNSKNYKIYPILLVFDETLQAFCANWYLSTRFENIMRAKNFVPSKFSLAKNHSTITFNEIFRLNKLDKNPIQKLELIQQYSDELQKNVMSLTLYNQQKSQNN